MSGLDLGDPGRPVDLIFVHANGFTAGTPPTRPTGQPIPG